MNESASLGPRLAACLDAIPRGARMADVGADHAQLALACVSTGRVPSAIVIERLEAPFLVARAAIARAGEGDRVESRLGDGLSALVPGEVHTVCIAGIGARTMAEILARAPGTRESLATLVLQPLLEASSLRRFLRAADWRLEDEQLVEEGGRIYEVLRAERGGADASYEGLDHELADWLGPCLLRTRGPLFETRVRWLKRVREKSLRELGRAQGVAARRKALSLERELAALEALER